MRNPRGFNFRTSSAGLEYSALSLGVAPTLKFPRVLSSGPLGISPHDCREARAGSATLSGLAGPFWPLAVADLEMKEGNVFSGLSQPTLATRQQILSFIPRRSASQTHARSWVATMKGAPASELGDAIQTQASDRVLTCLCVFFLFSSQRLPLPSFIQRGHSGLGREP